MSKAKLMVIATAGLTTTMLVSTLRQLGHGVCLIIEEKEPKSDIIKRRKKKLGWRNVSGQLAFLLFAKLFIGKRKKRIQAILNEANIAPAAENDIPNHHISSVHDKKLDELINCEQPQLIVINGTRILKKQLLNSIPCPVVNIHVGITPAYRGVHGGYWALRNKQPHLFGVTLHYVDTGIDTGKSIAQRVIQPTATDNFNTYPILQYTEGLQLLSFHLDAILANDAAVVQPLTNESKLYYHPTLWQYISTLRRVN